MKILNMLNIADFFFMAMGVGATLMMMIVGGHSDQGEKKDRAVDPQGNGRRKA